MMTVSDEGLDHRLAASLVTKIPRLPSGRGLLVENLRKAGLRE
jgi:hypothetical protein